MTIIRKTLGECIDFRPKYPERTARRAGLGLFSCYEFKTWPTREAMAKVIRREEKKEPSNINWKACQPLLDGEGY